MVLGFNHNLMYKGEIFHVQTEDSGVANPHMITLLYRGGIILCSKKTSYADILKMDSLPVVVAELMKDQHKEMMRRLKAGEFDEKAFTIKAQLIENYAISTLEPESDQISDLFVSSSVSDYTETGDISKLFELSEQAPNKVAIKPSDKPEKVTSQKGSNPDDIIRSFFGFPDK